LAGGVWIGFEWLRIGTNGGQLWVPWRTFGFLCHRVSYCYGAALHTVVSRKHLLCERLNHAACFNLILQVCNQC
jgi:hypothetical protein